jgi:hypothetical protein
MEALMSWNNIIPARFLGDYLLSADQEARKDRVSDWHATMALKAYRRRDYATYTRHIRIADQLRSR